MKTMLIPEPVAVARAALDEAAREFSRLKREECTTSAEVFNKILENNKDGPKVIWDLVCKNCEHLGKQCREYELEAKCRSSIKLLEELYGIERKN